MESLLDCLYGQASISSLTFKEVSIDAPALRLLKDFMGTHKDGDTLGVSSLVQLIFNCVDLDDASGSAWASLASVFLTKHEQVETIGSGIRSLSLVAVAGGGNGFLEELARNAHHIALMRLSLFYLGDEESQHLVQYISKTTCLRELDLDGVDDRIMCIACGAMERCITSSTVRPHTHSVCATSCSVHYFTTWRELRTMTRIQSWSVQPVP
jgi:hypothetical protein